MRYAETGFNLEIDLSTGNIERVASDPKDTELYLGGVGTNYKILWDRVPPEVEPFSPDNVIIFSAGLLGGTLAPGSNRTIITSISPQTLFTGFSILGGYWAPQLKYAGFDKIIVRGKAPDLVYIWIDNDKVEIRDASHLKGKSTYETARLIREEVNQPLAEVLSIGLAGENRVYFASIETATSSASRLGMGAIMGAKNLKAIAVRGTKDINIAQPGEFMEQCNQVLDYIQYRLENPIPGVPAILSFIGSPQEMALHDERWHTISFSWGNARIRRKDFWNEEVEREWTQTMENARKKLISCYNCPVRCRGIMQMPGYPSYTMKCFSKLTYVMAAMADDLDFGFKIAAIAQSHGVDGFTTPQVMAFAVELYEAGILTDEDLPNFPSENRERFYYLLDKIVKREGIGDVLAEGVYWAARKIGKGAEAYDHNTIKKHEQIPIKLGMLNPIYYIMWSTGEKANITQIEGQLPQAPLPKDIREEFVKDWIQIPTGKEERFKKFILEWGEEGKTFPFWPPPDLICELVEWQENMHYIDDSLGLCAGLSSFPLKPPYHMHNLPVLVSAGAGIEMDEDRLWETSIRVRNLVRASNVRRGMRRQDDKPPEDHWKKRFPDYEAKLLDEYYEYRGWNREGVPKKETLQKLGLDFVYEDFAKRGILEE
ncbi:MAG: aldehyde dehydrogenase [Deltaproteobacteria bacterium]|nr:aldehyde dehydrogenase [Deltaproteobacteria bacterium]